MSVYHPNQCTEREPDGSYEDCTWCTGVMIWNAMNGRTVVPPIRAEYEALRVAGGDGPAEHTHDGSNFTQLTNGMMRRYGHAPLEVRGSGFARLWSDLAPGVIAGIAGDMGSTSVHLRRWDPGFGANGTRAAHAAVAIRDDATDYVWWMNPLAPASYPGERISKVMLRAYYEGLGDIGYVYATVGLVPPDTATAPEEPIVDIDVTSTSAQIVDLPAGTKILNPDGSLRLTSAAGRKNVLSPFGSTSTGGTALRTIVWTAPAPAPDLLLAVYRNAVTNVRPAAADTAAVDTAVRAAVAHIKAAHDAESVAITEALPR